MEERVASLQACNMFCFLKTVRVWNAKFWIRDWGWCFTLQQYLCHKIFRYLAPPLRCMKFSAMRSRGEVEAIEQTNRRNLRLVWLSALRRHLRPRLGSALFAILIEQENTVAAARNICRRYVVLSISRHVQASLPLKSPGKGHSLFYAL